MNQTTEEFNTDLLPYICIRCERGYVATCREMASLPKYLCVGCYTKLLFSDNHDEIPEFKRLGGVVQILDYTPPEFVSETSVDTAVQQCIER